ncbi:baseplate J/gp47 family protein [Candidatus Desantisbacteria bacterium]|nr:baseplate J/gp47 family protein [Candidatus Desantisbacteria bacterium]
MNETQSYVWTNFSGQHVITQKQGIDYLIVSADQKTLEVYFFKDISYKIDKSVFRIEGGQRIKNIGISTAEIDKHNKNKINITLDRYGDWSPYRLIISESVWSKTKMDIDPVFSSIRFSFKINCPGSGMDCKSHIPADAKFPAIKNFDYQAKDYESFKQAMLDRLPTQVPGWWDRSEADFGIALIDILAYAGDRLSYYQDRVATESRLKTARDRSSVSRHLKLIDYTLFPGQTALVLIYFNIDRDLIITEDTKIQTQGSENSKIFTLQSPFPVFAVQSEIILYDFSHPSLVIPEGSLQIVVKGLLEGLNEGSYIVLLKEYESIENEKHLIKLSSKPVYLPVSDTTILSWDKKYTLPWDVCVSKGRILGNIAEFLNAEKCDGKENILMVYENEKLEHIDLLKGPVGYLNGQPLINITIDGEVWSNTDSLCSSLPYDKHYQVIDLDDEKNRIQFGDNINGLRPDKDSNIQINYYRGLGSEGNVAPGVLTKFEKEIPGVNYIMNPFAGFGGCDPEKEARAKIWGPKKVREQKRAVTPEDYEREAVSVPGISRALARFIWTGSWFTVRVTLDPAGTEELSDDLKNAVLKHLRTRKMAGYDIQIFPAVYVPLDIKIEFCVKDTAFRDQVLMDLNKVLGSSKSIDGVKGFFNPDNWTFGKGVRLSSLYAAISTVQGIECTEVTKFQNLRNPGKNELRNREIPMQWDEIARLDNDKNFPEHGKLELELIGGR